MAERRVSIHTSAVGFTLALAAALAETGLLAWFYHDLAIEDRGRFLLFYAAGIVTVMTAVIGAGSALVVARFREERRAVGIAFGAALGAFVILTTRWVMAVRTGELGLLDGRTVAGAALLLVGTLTVGGSGYLLARSPIARWRGGWRAALACLILAIGAFLTRTTDYDPPPTISPEPTKPDRSSLDYRDTNLLLISIDTLRADHLNSYGYARETAPAIGELARRGIVFERAITQRTYTGPAMATLLTGTYPPTHRVLNNRDYLQDFNITLAEMLGGYGYEACGFVANPNLISAFNFDQGFTEYQRDVFQPELAGDENMRESRSLNRQVFPVLRDIKDRRFFLWIHYNDPHSPYVVPRRYRGLYAGDQLAMRRGHHEFSLEWLYGQMAGVDEFYRNRDLSFVVSQYDAQIRFNDESIGEIFEKLTEYDLWDSTLLVIVGDHGESFGEHSYFGHGTHVYEDNAHVPLIFYHPLLPSGVRIENVVSLVDIAPTVSALLGVPPSPLFQGESFADILLGNEASRLRPYHFVMGRDRRGYKTIGVRTGTHKLIFDVDQRWLIIDALVERVGRLWLPQRLHNVYRFRKIDREFYDLVEDPHENHNAIDDYPEMAAVLGTELWSWIGATYYEGQRRAVYRGDITPEIEDQLKVLGYAE